jgi:hypothetical protein
MKKQFQLFKIALLRNNKLFFAALIPAFFILTSCGSSQENEEGETEVILEDSTQTSDRDGFVEIFDGQTLNGWEGDSTYWRVENGNLVGEVTPTTLLENNTFIIWQGGSPADFEFTGEFNITEEGNSGINYRSEQLTDIPFALRGYQADIDGKNAYTGQNYEERKRTTLAYRGQATIIKPQESTGELRENIEKNAWLGLEVKESLGDRDSLKSLINQGDWNSFRLVIKGNRLQHYINDVLMSDVTDEDTVNRTMEGLLGIQVHVGPPMKVQYRNLRLKEL